ncbi:MAG: TIGR03790 family protein [Armatimonadetes bacterium]|nr:TIGR03790 family protein [Armatimonadota bacterium]MDE2207691.1 TIGR03790 family protein [Armatimonadota bacterium]
MITPSTHRIVRFSTLAAMLGVGMVSIGGAAAGAKTSHHPSPPRPVPDTERVLVVENASSPASVTIANDYMLRRHVHNIVKIQCADSAVSAANETTTWKVFETAILGPVVDFVEAHPAIDFIVLTKGVPIRIADAPGMGLHNTTPSVDSTLAAIGYDSNPAAERFHINDSGFTGTGWANRFWRSEVPFSHARFGGYLVTRLDGYTVADAIALTTRSLEATRPPTGDILLDTNPGTGYVLINDQPLGIFDAAKPGDPTRTLPDITYNNYNTDMVKAAMMLESRHVPVELDLRPKFVGNRQDLAGYASWGSNDGNFDPKAYHSLTFAPGAIGDTAVSTSGRTFLPTTGGQSLVADLIAQGITGVKGYSDEPLLSAISSPSVLFKRYTEGWTLAESFYAASRFLGWEDIVLGDPICRPYARRMPAEAPTAPHTSRHAPARRRAVKHRP